jgi:hypothetical protein
MLNCARSSTADNCPGPDRLVGRDLLELITGSEVRDFYRARHEAVLLAGAPSIAFEYRCDAPDVRRDMRMTISRLDLPGSEPLILYHSQLLSQIARPWMNVFEPGRALERLGDELHLPIVTMCGICQRLAWPLGRKAVGPEWIEAETYYRRGGAADVRISHGVCEACMLAERHADCAT